MTRLLQPFFALLATATDARLAQMVEYLKAENAVLRAKLPTRITVTAPEKARLVKLGTALGGALKNLITIVSPRTFARWAAGNGTAGGTPKPASGRKPGRPRTAEDLRKLVVKLATENGWGYTRVLGELKKLGISTVCRSTVVNILKGAGLDPGPQRGKGTWAEFVARHAATLWASDFVSVRTLTAAGVVDLYLLFFIHVGTRKVTVSAPTATAGCRRCGPSAWTLPERNTLRKYARDSRPERTPLDSDQRLGFLANSELTGGAIGSPLE